MIVSLSKVGLTNKQCICSAIIILRYRLLDVHSVCCHRNGSGSGNGSVLTHTSAIYQSNQSFLQPSANVPIVIFLDCVRVHSFTIVPSNLWLLDLSS